MKRRGILVARVSTPAQAEEDRYSIEAQFRLMREGCARGGIEIGDERVEPGRSAFTPDLRQLRVLYQTVLDIEAEKAMPSSCTSRAASHGTSSSPTISSTA